MHASFYRTSLYCTLQILCSFTGWSSVATLWSSKSKGTIFPTALANFKSLSHFGNSGNISNFLMTIIFATDLWSVISDYSQQFPHPANSPPTYRCPPAHFLPVPTSLWQSSPPLPTPSKSGTAVPPVCTEIHKGWATHRLIFNSGSPPPRWNPTINSPE